MNLTLRQKGLIRKTFIDFKQTSEFLENPLIIDRAEGLYYWDANGTRYFDAIGGIYVALLGHRHPRLIEAVRDQLEKLTFAPPLHGISNVTLDFVERLGAVAPGNLKFVKGFSGGSEANEAAMKFARQYFSQTGHPQKYKFISNYLSYHGGTFAAMSATGTGKRKTKFEPHMPGFLKNYSPIQLRDRFDSWEEANRFCAGLFEDIICSEDPDTIAGIIMEPICNTGGIVVPTNEYFRIVRDICNRYNILLIFDEVLTGIAKTGRMFAAETFDVVPDIITSGKALSSGVVPVGAMMVREDLSDAFYGRPGENVQFAHGHTFAGNPLSCAVAIAVLDEVEQSGLIEKAVRLGRHLRLRLEGLKKFGVVREVRGKGVLLGVELVQDTGTNDPFPEGNKLGNQLKKTSLENGLIMRVDPDWFAVAPPLIAEEADIDEMCDRIEKSLKDALDRLN
ncbi:MAG: aspartate aminotransferase family protein [Syntrophaceae bacterium]|nr:aspartate aminotransferase family protein [Syntrophaceae bacterium]